MTQLTLWQEALCRQIVIGPAAIVAVFCHSKDDEREAEVLVKAGICDRWVHRDFILMGLTEIGRIMFQESGLRRAM